jgi:predicted Kef-type K+ transport protein
MFLMGRLGYTKKNSFKAGLTVAQISEFSFILIILGANVGYLSGDILSLISIV